MNAFSVILLDGILVAFPFMLWLLYQVYIKTLSKEKNDLLFDLTLFTSSYLVLKYGVLDFKYLPFLLLNIPLILAYYKKRDLSIILLSIVNAVYYDDTYNLNLEWLIVIYLLYYIVYLIMKKYNKNQFFIKIFIIWKMFVTFIIITLLLEKITTIYNLAEITVIIMSFNIVMHLIISLFKQEEQILALHLKMEQVQRDKNITDSLFKITHEIKNPIAVCKGYLDMFDINDINHSRKYIPILKTEINKILVLLEDFLSINRVKINKEIIDINYLLEEIINNFKPILEVDNIVLEFDEDEETYMSADYNRLSQVIVNVVKNSMEAVRNREKSYIKVYTEKTKNNIKINIEDNGEGISKENLEKMNQPFFTTKENGTGLGVYLSREIVKLHGGTMVYKSKKNKGTKVVITLPIEKGY